MMRWLAVPLLLLTGCASIGAVQCAVSFGVWGPCRKETSTPQEEMMGDFELIGEGVVRGINGMTYFSVAKIQRTLREMKARGEDPDNLALALLDEGITPTSRQQARGEATTDRPRVHFDANGERVATEE